MIDRGHIDRALDIVQGAPDVMGAALVSRDGILLKAAGKVNLTPETFSAMSATLMGAAEIALSAVDAGTTRVVTAETQAVKMILVGATQELLLIAYTDARVRTADVLPVLLEAAAVLHASGADRG